MKKILSVILLLFSMTTFAQKITDPVTIEGWSNDSDYIFTKANKEQRPIMINFTGSDWCGWCKVIKRDYFSKSAFKVDLVEQYGMLLLEADFPSEIRQSAALKEQNRHLANTYKISGYPTIVILYKDRIYKTGYHDEDVYKWIKDIERNVFYDN